jgi:hypothetical protein
MRCINKKSQIIQGYLDEILPYVDYQKESQDALEYKCKFKFGKIEEMNNVNIKQSDDDSFILDFSSSSIHEVYTSLNQIHKKIFLGV